MLLLGNVVVRHCLHETQSVSYGFPRRAWELENQINREIHV